MTGELWPTPASGCFQRKLASSHVVGISTSSLCPAPFGPRNRAQFSAAEMLDKTATRNAAAIDCPSHRSNNARHIGTGGRPHLNDMFYLDMRHGSKKLPFNVVLLDFAV